MYNLEKRNKSQPELIKVAECINTNKKEPTSEP